MATWRKKPSMVLRERRLNSSALLNAGIVRQRSERELAIQRAIDLLR